MSLSSLFQWWRMHTQKYFFCVKGLKWNKLKALSSRIYHFIGKANYIEKRFISNNVASIHALYVGKPFPLSLYKLPRAASDNL